MAFLPHPQRHTCACACTRVCTCTRACTCTCTRTCTCTCTCTCMCTCTCTCACARNAACFSVARRLRNCAPAAWRPTPGDSVPGVGCQFWLSLAGTASRASPRPMPLFLTAALDRKPLMLLKKDLSAVSLVCSKSSRKACTLPLRADPNFHASV